MEEDFVVRVPSEWMIKIFEAGGVEAIRNLQNPWAVIIQEDSGAILTKGFEDQSSCADLVAKLHGSGAEPIYVLKKGIPRKNVKIEVRARFR